LPPLSSAGKTKKKNRRGSCHSGRKEGRKKIYEKKLTTTTTKGGGNISWGSKVSEKKLLVTCCRTGGGRKNPQKGCVTEELKGIWKWTACNDTNRKHMKNHDRGAIGGGKPTIKEGVRAGASRKV